MSAPVTPRAMHTVTLATYNTLTLVAWEVYELVAPFANPLAGGYYCSILNLGPGTVYLRETEDPDPNDPATETLPPLVADNLIVTPDSPRGLLVMADQNGRITARVVRGDVY